MSHAASVPTQELSLYHDKTIALLRRYFRMSLEIGRMPSVLGREVFRARVTSYRVRTFEDAVIFVHDVEKCLEQVEPFSRQLIARVILPNVLIAVLSGAFLTFAIVIGEFTMASLLNRPAFGPYLQNIGANRAYEPAALAVIAFAITWGCMSIIQVLSRFAPKSANQPH